MPVIITKLITMNGVPNGVVKQMGYARERFSNGDVGVAIPDILGSVTADI